MHFGPEEVLLALDVEFKDDQKADDIEQVVQRLEAQIREKFPIVKRIFIEAKSLSIPKNPADHPPVGDTREKPEG